jgi:hypothetical protein
MALRIYAQIHHERQAWPRQKFEIFAAIGTVSCVEPKNNGFMPKYKAKRRA